MHRQVFVGEQSGLHNHNPVWSTDGQWIYFTHGYTDEMDVWRMPSSGGVPERVTQHNAKVSFLAPLDSRTLLYVAPAEDRSGPWLWALDVERKISTGQAPASSNIGPSRPAPMAGASSRRWPIPAPAYGPCHCSDVWPRSATSDRFRCLRFVPWRRDSAGRRCFICQHAGWDRRRVVALSRWKGIRDLEGLRRGARSSRPPYRMTGSASFSHSDGMGNGASPSCRRRALRHGAGRIHRRSKRCRLVAGCAMDRHWRSRRRAGRGIVQSARGWGSPCSAGDRARFESGLVAGRDPDRVCGSASRRTVATVGGATGWFPSRIAASARRAGPRTGPSFSTR